MNSLKISILVKLLLKKSKEFFFVCILLRVVFVHTPIVTYWCWHVLRIKQNTHGRNITYNIMKCSKINVKVRKKVLPIEIYLRLDKKFAPDKAKVGTVVCYRHLRRQVAITRRVKMLQRKYNDTILVDVK